MTVKMVQGDVLPPLVTALKETIETTACKTTKVAKDLTGYEVRGRFCVGPQIATDPCVESGVEEAENSLFYRVLTLLETDILPTTIVTALVDLDPAAQPAGPQKLQLEITGFAGAGSVTIVGKDVDGNEVTDTIAVTADGVLVTTESFDSIDEDGIAADGDFSVRIFVHDGRVQLDWQDGDLGAPGTYFLELEIFPSGGGGPRQTVCEKITVVVKAKKPLASPVVSSVAPETTPAGVELTLTGTGFLEASGALLDDGTPVSLTGITVNSETELLGTIPVGTPGGIYDVYATNADGDGPPLVDSVTVTPLIESIAPESLSPGDILTVTGQGFTGATSAEIELGTGGTPIVLTGFAVNSDTEVEGVVPAGTPGGLYLVRVISPTGPSNDFLKLTVA